MPTVTDQVLLSVHWMQSSIHLVKGEGSGGGGRKETNLVSDSSVAGYQTGFFKFVCTTNTLVNK